jgi:hypothetical protein
MPKVEHSIFGNNIPKTLYKILNDGFLKSSSKTKNVKLYGYKKGSPYVFLELAIDDTGLKTTLILDEKLLLEHNFYLHIGWSGEVDKDEKKYIGKELSSPELSKILNKFEKDIRKSRITESMSNEILVKNNISLKKYLLEIRIMKKLMDESPKLLEYIKTNYPDVKITLL